MKKIYVFLGLLCIAILFGLLFAYTSYSKYSFGYKSNLSVTDIRELVSRIEAINYNSSSNPTIPEFLFPQTIGNDARNGKVLEVKYFCYDICPDQGHIRLIYKGIDSREDCEKVGGAAYDSGMPKQGNFLGCMPKEALEITVSQ